MFVISEFMKLAKNILQARPVTSTSNLTVFPQVPPLLEDHHGHINVHVVHGHLYSCYSSLHSKRLRTVPLLDFSQFILFVLIVLPLWICLSICLFGICKFFLAPKSLFWSPRVKVSSLWSSFELHDFLLSVPQIPLIMENCSQNPCHSILLLQFSRFVLSD